MDDQNDYDFENEHQYDEGSDRDNFENEQVFQDREGDEGNDGEDEIVDDEEEEWDPEPNTDHPGVNGPSEDSYLDNVYEDRYDLGD